jgi:two-component system, response regulator, stage 0 sporulation protein F
MSDRVGEISAVCGLIPGTETTAANLLSVLSVIGVGELLELHSSVTNKQSILVVDDEPLTRWSVAETLRDSGYAVAQAGDALQALESVRAKGADVVLIDALLPDSTDLRVVSVLRRLSPESKIIVMTAYGSDALNREARSRGALTVLDKPFDMSVLPPVVARALAV